LIKSNIQLYNRATAAFVSDFLSSFTQHLRARVPQLLASEVGPREHAGESVDVINTHG